MSTNTQPDLQVQPFTRIATPDERRHAIFTR
jgi:hypothetical protein